MGPRGSESQLSRLLAEQNVCPPEPQFPLSNMGPSGAKGGNYPVESTCGHGAITTAYLLFGYCGPFHHRPCLDEVFPLLAPLP